MKGLLMKDLLNLKQTIRVWALLLALFIVIGFAQQSPRPPTKGLFPGGNSPLTHRVSLSLIHI